MGECLITRRGGEAYELPILNENYPQDVNLTVIEGNTTSATFEVNITTDGKPPSYTYQWYVDGVAVEGATSMMFVKSDLSDNASHSIYCEVTNKAGTVISRVATLKVEKYTLPVLNESYPANASVSYKYGSSTSATFSVSVATQGNPATYTYQWYVNGSAVSGATSSSYTKSGLNSETSYTVYCTVTNAAGTVTSRTATLTVTMQRTYLFNANNQCTSVTGGWESKGYDVASEGYSLGSLSIGSTIKLTCSSTSLYNNIAAITKKTINFTNYSRISVKVTDRSGNTNTNASKEGGAWFYLPNSNSKSVGNVGQSYIVAISGTGTYTINIANCSSSLYAKLDCMGSNMTVSEVWMY